MATESEEERAVRLQQMRDRLATESEEERAVRLQQMRDRLASETEEERAARLQRMSANQRHRLASETEEERAAKLQQMSANQCHRLATETEEERAARLQRMRDRLASETEEERAGSEREAKLQRNREGQRGQQSQLPLFEQPSVQAKMRKFHAEIAGLEMQKCTTCSEGFPGLQLRSHSTECVRCNRDKHVPKLYSSMNNMDPTIRPAPTAPHQQCHTSCSACT